MSNGLEMLEREVEVEHYREIYGEDEGYPCPLCGEKCKTLTEFHRHNEKVHGARRYLR